MSSFLEEVLGLAYSNLATETRITVGLLTNRLERRLAVIALFLPLITKWNDCWSEQLCQIDIGHQGERLQNFQFLLEGVNFLSQHLPLQSLHRCWSRTHRPLRRHSLFRSKGAWCFLQDLQLVLKQRWLKLRARLMPRLMPRPNLIEIQPRTYF